MYKLVAFIKKLPNLSMEEFIDYYETNHAPLIMRLLPFSSAYRRNYLKDAVRPDQAPTEFDVITELEFETESSFLQFKKALFSPEVVAQVRADERNFLQSQETRLWEVEPRKSQ